MISVIVPVYNVSNYLAECLDALLQQSYTNLEIIVVDDGSTDGSEIIVDTYAKRHPQIKGVHQTNQGVSSARNAGLALATGEYIGFCDSDDVVHPDMYHTLLGLLEDYHADIAQIGYQLVISNQIVEQCGTGELFEFNHEEALISLLSGAHVGPGLCNKLFRRQLIAETRLSKQLKINEDLLFNYYLLKKSQRLVFLDQSFYSYQIREGSATTGSSNQFFRLQDPINVFEEIYQDCQGNQQLTPLAWQRYLRNLSRKVVKVKGYDQKKLAQSELKMALVQQSDWGGSHFFIGRFN